MEDKTDFVDSAADVRPPYPKVYEKTNNLEQMLARMGMPDPWAA